MSTTTAVNMRKIRKGDRVALAADASFTGTVMRVKRTAGEKWSGNYSYQYKVTWTPYVEVRWDRALPDYRTQSSVGPEEIIMVGEVAA